MTTEIVVTQRVTKICFNLRDGGVVRDGPNLSFYMTGRKSRSVKSKTVGTFGRGKSTSYITTFEVNQVKSHHLKR